MLKVILLALCVSGIYGNIQTRLMRKLRNSVKDLEETHDAIITSIYNLETNLTAIIDGVVPAPGSGGSGQGTGASVPGGDFLERLKDLEGRVEAIKNYLMGEKKVDISLRQRSEEVIKEMKDKVTETGVVITDLKEDVKNSLNDFEGKIDSVNKTAYIKINANGAVLYGGIGSSCSTNGGECSTDDSECRGGKCQCVPGMSYNLQERMCASSCQTYGSTYQSVPKRIIRGFNDITIEDIDLKECTKRCTAEESFDCKSFDYFPQWESCFLSANTKSDAGDDVWEYNMEGYHFQRDCLQ